MPHHRAAGALLLTAVTKVAMLQWDALTLQSHFSPLQQSSGESQLTHFPIPQDGLTEQNFPPPQDSTIESSESTDTGIHHGLSCFLGEHGITEEPPIN